MTSRPEESRSHNLTFAAIVALIAAAGLATQTAGHSAPHFRSGAQPQPQTDPGFPLTNTADPEARLADLAGVFRVDLRINPHQWFGNTAMLNPDGTPAATTAPGVPIGVNQQGGVPGNQPGQGNQPGSVPVDAAGNPIPAAPNRGANQNNQNQTQSGRPIQGQDPNFDNRGQGGDMAGGMNPNSVDPMDAALNGTVNVRGYCEKRWILGGNILQENCVIPDLAEVIQDAQMGDTARNANQNAENATRNTGQEANQNTGQNVDPDGNVIQDDIEIGRPSMEAIEADRMFQSVSFLTFNERSGTFSLTSMDSRQVDSLSAVGQFVPGANRIEFALTPGTQFGTSGPFNNQFNTQSSDPGVTGTNQVSPANQTGNQTGNQQPNSVPGSPNNNATNNTNPNQRTTTTPPNANPNSTANPANARQPGATPPNNPNAADPNNRTGNQRTNQGGNQTGRQPVNPATDPDPAANNRLADQRAINANAGTALTSSAGAFDNVRVVLEFLSPDQHRVTLYRLNPGQQGSEFFNPFLVQPAIPGSDPRIVADDDLDDDDFVGVVPNNRNTGANQPGNQGTNTTGTNNTGNNNAGNNTGNTPRNDTGAETTPGTTPRTTGTAPRTSSGEPQQAVPDAPGTRPNNTDQPAAPQNTTPGQNDRDGAGRPVAPGTVVVDPNNPNRNNQTGQPGVNQFNQTGNQFNPQSGDDMFAADSAGWVVIWQATYTRVDGAEASRFRNHLQRADQLAQNFTERRRAARQAGVRDDN